MWTYAIKNKDDKISFVIIMFYNLADDQEQNKKPGKNLQKIMKKVDNQNE